MPPSLQGTVAQREDVVRHAQAHAPHPPCSSGPSATIDVHRLPVPSGGDCAGGALVQRFTPLLIDAARPCRHAPGDRWFVDETSVTIAGRGVYRYRAIDQFGQVIDVLVSPKRDLTATRRFVTRAFEHGPRPVEVITDKAALSPPVLQELVAGAGHHSERSATTPIDADHRRLASRLGPIRGLPRLSSARVISAWASRLRLGTCHGESRGALRRMPRKCRRGRRVRDRRQVALA
jgi:IS6 family transposase